MEGNVAVLIGEDRFVHAVEAAALALGAGSLLGQVINTQDHIL